MPFCPGARYRATYRALGDRATPPFHQDVIATFPFLVSIPTYPRRRRSPWPCVLEEGRRAPGPPRQAHERAEPPLTAASYQAPPARTGGAEARVDLAEPPLTATSPPELAETCNLLLPPICNSFVAGL